MKIIIIILMINVFLMANSNLNKNEINNKILDKKYETFNLNKFYSEFKTNDDEKNIFIKKYFNQDIKINNKIIKFFSPKKISYLNKSEKISNKISLEKLKTIKNHIKKHNDTYILAENIFNINKEIIAAILYKETRLGNYVPKYTTNEVFFTMLSPKFNYEKYKERTIKLKNSSKKSLTSLIDFCYNHKIEPLKCNFKSSYAGAIGSAQFMPFNLKYIIPNNKDYDLNNIKVSILSIGNYLNSLTKLKKIDFKQLNSKTDIENTIEKWYEFEFKTKNSTFGKTKKTLNCFVCNKSENYKEIQSIVNNIMRYNNSSNYAVGVLNIAYKVWKLESEDKNKILIKKNK